MHLYGVDIWQSYEGYKDFNSEDILDAYEEVKTLYSSFGDRATAIKGWSRDIAPTVEDESLDFVFIDGNHAYEWVVEDLALWTPKVKKGGIVYGHDYDDYSDTKRWDKMNVINAVDGWCKSYKINPYFVTTNNPNKCWLYVK